MKIETIITTVDRLMPNTISNDIKLGWLKRLDMIVYDEVVKTHEKPSDYEEPDFDSYDFDTDLIIPEQWVDVYLQYLKMKIAFEQVDSERYEMEQTAYNNQYISFQAWYTRKYMPLQYYPDYRGYKGKCTIVTPLT